MKFLDGFNQRIESPFQVKEFVKVDFVVVLNVLIVKCAICENVMHVVFWAPPFQTISTGQGRNNSTVLHEEWMSVVSH